MNFEDLPKDFNHIAYRKYNPHLANLNRNQCIEHYLLKGKFENLKFSLKDQLPKDFNTDNYREFHPDISRESDEWLEAHYVFWGKDERRIYKIDLPNDFNVEVYRHLNKDISDLPPGWLKAHYANHGKFEGRQYKDPWFDKEWFIKENNVDPYIDYEQSTKDVRLLKSQRALDYINQLPDLTGTLLLVCHDDSIYGATHYLYLLYNHLKKIGIKCKLIEPDKNLILYKKYNIKEEETLLYYNDASLLYWICKKTNPRKVLFNSMNTSIARVLSWLESTDYLIHSHEVQQHYLGEIVPNFVVSNRIAKQYKDVPRIQPPLISEETFKIIDSEVQNICRVRNNYGSLNHKRKITIGMCGSLTERKNYKLFEELAALFPNYNFLWIGGSRDLNSDLKNFYHVRDVEHPYKYYNLIDYFLLTSAEDPCPYVVLENLYINNKVLTFRDNIYTDHKHPSLKDLYFEYPGSISLKTASLHIENIVQGKSQTNAKSGPGRDYIKQYFSSFTDDFIEALTK